MRNSIVNIESVSNNSFGTGFVIDSDEKGIYILTCAHVVDDVETPVVENVLAKVVAKGSFVDMAVLYVSKLHLEALSLQTDTCENLDVEVIGFSSFNQNLTQKKHINATLYRELIELHSKEDDLFYTVRKIKANDGFNFDRGNSGSPVICKDSGNVIAMISNKEGSDIGYAINIANIKEVWRDIPSKLFEIKEVKVKREQKEKIEPVSGKKEERIIPPAPQTNQSNSSMGKYLLSGVLVVALGFGAYNFMKPSPSSGDTQHEPITSNDKQAQIEAKKRAEDEARIKVQRAREEAKRKAQAKREALARKEQLRQQQEATKKEAEREKQKEEKARLEKAYYYEKQGFKFLLSKNYAGALRNFKQANTYKASLHDVQKIVSLLGANINKMNNTVTKRKVLTTILRNYSRYAPKGFTETLKRQLRPTILSPDRLKGIDLSKIKIQKAPQQIDYSKIHLGQPIQPISPKK